MSAEPFMDRLNRLFREVYPPGRGPYSTVEVAQGTGLSPSYLRYLRDGSRRNPSIKHVAALAAFFRVEPGYFFADHERLDAMEHLALLAALHRDPVRRVAAHLPRLSDAALHLLDEMASHLLVATTGPAVLRSEVEGAGAP